MLKTIACLALALSLCISNPVLAGGRLVVGPSDDGVQISQKRLPGGRDAPLDLTGMSGTTQIQENCQYGNDGITRCDNCDVDWDMTPPDKICITASICYDNNGKSIPCP